MLKTDVIDLALALPTWLAAIVLRILRRKGISRFKRCQSILDTAGVFPLIDHYYDPYIQLEKIREGLDVCRSLPGIDWNEDGQLAELGSLKFADEMRGVPLNPTGKKEREYYYNNPMFGAGSADIYYQMIRKYKPRRIVEIGCGMSTLIAQKAIVYNLEEDSSVRCDHICVEPFEQPWLELLPVELIRKKVEDLEVEFFDELQAGDILFIDSSHTVRPGGDVLFEYLELLPRLKQGVFVHIHDIFSPQDYPASWFDKGILWQEQYIVEAFLSCNENFRISLALNWLFINHQDTLLAACPSLAVHSKSARGPSSLWLQRT